MTTSRHFKPITQAEPSDAEIQAFADRRGTPSLKAVSKPAEKAPQAASQPSPDKVSDQPTTRLAFEVPLYLADQLKIRAVTERCSTRFLILKAVQAAGYEIHDEDLIADGRRIRR